MRSKILLVLIIYAAGFATAIYALAPAKGESQGFSDSTWFSNFTENRETEGGLLASSNMERLMAKANYGIEKCIELVEEKAATARALAKEKLKD